MMKKTALSKKELEILEKVITTYGYVVSFDELKTLLADHSYETLKQRIKTLSQRGWFIRIKKGYYAVANLESHNFSNVSPLVISQVLVPGSYVSLEFALSRYGYFDQLPDKVTSVTDTNSRKFQFQGFAYQYVKAKPEMMMGFRELAIEGRMARVAEIEKALLDFLQFRKDSYTVSLVLEKLRDAKGDIDTQKIAKYAGTYPVSVRRRMGFLLDVAELDSEPLHKSLRDVSGNTKLTKDSKTFNSKWRVYYEDRFTK